MGNNQLYRTKFTHLVKVDDPHSNKLVCLNTDYRNEQILNNSANERRLAPGVLNDALANNSYYVVESIKFSTAFNFPSSDFISFHNTGFHLDLYGNVIVSDELFDAFTNLVDTPRTVINIYSIFGPGYYKGFINRTDAENQYKLLKEQNPDTNFRVQHAEFDMSGRPTSAGAGRIGLYIIDANQDKAVTLENLWSNNNLRVYNTNIVAGRINADLPGYVIQACEPVVNWIVFGDETGFDDYQYPRI